MTTIKRRIAGALCIIGALNWGLVAIAEFDLVAELFGMGFGETNAATRVVYGLVGLAGVVLAATLFERADDTVGHRATVDATR